MTQPPSDEFSKLLSLAVHEFRTPMTIVTGYVRMLLSNRMGSLTEQQRHLLKETERSVSRLTTLVSELSDVGHFDAGTVPMNRSTLDLSNVVREAIQEVHLPPDRSVSIAARGDCGEMSLSGDALRLRRALSSVIWAVLRETIQDELAVEQQLSPNATREARLNIGDAATLDHIRDLPVDSLVPFDRWRGGVGLSLVIADQVIMVHGGRLLAPTSSSPRAPGAIVLLPLLE